MSKLREYLKGGFDVVEVIQRLVAMVDLLQDDIAEIRAMLQEQRQAKPKKDPPKAES
jgi:hypothetical protein